MIKQSNTDCKLGLKFRFAIVKKETNELIGTILYFTENKDSKKRMDKDQIQTTYINTENQVRNSARR